MAWEQLFVPGLKAMRGATRVEGKPGMWHINPSELSETKWLKRAEKNVEQEANLAERGPQNVPSMSGIRNARSANMLLGALNELRYANEMKKMLGTDPGVRGVVAVSPSGHIRAGAAINKKKAQKYLADPDSLDFTTTYPNYLEYVATTTPEFRGSDILREIQKAHGDDMVFQVADPSKNVPIYERMGAQRMPLTPSGDDILEGGVGLPAFRIFKGIPERSNNPASITVDPRQTAFEGFKGGGLVQMQQGGKPPEETVSQAQWQMWIDEMIRKVAEEQSRRDAAKRQTITQPTRPNTPQQPTQPPPLKMTPPSSGVGLGNRRTGGLVKYKECNCHG